MAMYLERVGMLMETSEQQINDYVVFSCGGYFLLFFTVFKIQFLFKLFSCFHIITAAKSLSYGYFNVEV